MAIHLAGRRIAMTKWKLRGDYRVITYSCATTICIDWTGGVVITLVGVSKENNNKNGAHSPTIDSNF